MTGVDFDFLQLVQPPRIISMTPLHGPVRGGTALVLTGAQFGNDATITFVERDRNNVATGVRTECAWRGVEEMSCSDTRIRWV